MDRCRQGLYLALLLKIQVLLQCTLRPLVRSMTLWFCCLVHDFVAEVFTVRILCWLKIVDDVKFPRRFYFVCVLFSFVTSRDIGSMWRKCHDPLKSFLLILSKRIKIVWWRLVSTNHTRHVPIDAWKLVWLSSAKLHIPCLPSPVEQTDGTEILNHLPSVFRSHGNAVSCVSSVLKTEQKRKYRGFTLICKK